MHQIKMSRKTRKSASLTRRFYSIKRAYLSLFLKRVTFLSAHCVAFLLTFALFFALLLLIKFYFIRFSRGRQASRRHFDAFVDAVVFIIVFIVASLWESSKSRRVPSNVIIFFPLDFCSFFVFAAGRFVAMKFSHVENVRIER